MIDQQQRTTTNITAVDDRSLARSPNWATAFPTRGRPTLQTNKLFRIALQFAYEIARAVDSHAHRPATAAATRRRGDAASVYISDDDDDDDVTCRRSTSHMRWTRLHNAVLTTNDSTRAATCLLYIAIVDSPQVGPTTTIDKFTRFTSRLLAVLNASTVCILLSHQLAMLHAKLHRCYRKLPTVVKFALSALTSTCTRRGPHLPLSALSP